MSIDISAWLESAAPNHLIRLKGAKVPGRKSEFIDFISRFSFQVPSLEARTSSLDWWESHSNIKSCQAVTALCVSTAQIGEIEQMSDSLSKSIVKCWSAEKDETALLDYVLSEDWGKVLLISEKEKNKIIESAIKRVHNSRSDELALFVIKLCTQRNERQIVEKAVGRKGYAELMFTLLQKAKGRTGGLLKAAAFLLRRESPLINEGISIPLDRVKDFTVSNELDDQTLFAIISLLVKVGNLDVSRCIEEFSESHPAAIEMLLYTFGHRVLIWDEIQASCIASGIAPFNNQAIKSKTLNSFYEALAEKGQEGHGGAKKLNKSLKVGVIITTFNPDTVKLKSSISSVLHQNYKNTYVVLIDDNSSPEIQEEIDRVVSEIDDTRVVFYRNPENIGQYLSRNKAVELMEDCDYFTIQDDDDFSHPDRIQEQLYLITGNDQLKLVMAQQARFTEDMRYVADKRDPLIFDPSPATSMFSRETFKEVGGFSNVRTRGDTEYIQRIKNRWGEESISYVDAPLYLMRCTPDTVSASKDKTLKSQLDVFRRKMSNPEQFQNITTQQWALSK
ncbi:glycosyltransferase family A protein [Carnimonas bestiolae]|uniref:glycosyltransferase family A protein n=1 Tax=Carnimonas bestiolae TaxID=3402172 RepID=UPI003EDCB1B4